MSLLLRKKCQELLDGVDLHSYHVQIDEHSKCLQVVGECGKVLVTVTGIRLSRMAPSLPEVELALELFDSFVLKHQKTFKDYIKSVFKMSSVSIPTKIKVLPLSSIDKSTYKDSYTLTFKLASDTNRKVVISSDGTIEITKVVVKTTDLPTDKVISLATATLSKKELTASLKWMSDCNEYNKYKDIKEKLLATLNSCEI